MTYTDLVSIVGGVGSVVIYACLVANYKRFLARIPDAGTQVRLGSSENEFHFRLGTYLRHTAISSTTLQPQKNPISNR